MSCNKPTANLCLYIYVCHGLGFDLSPCFSFPSFRLCSFPSTLIVCPDIFFTDYPSPSLLWVFKSMSSPCFVGLSSYPVCLHMNVFLWSLCLDFSELCRSIWILLFASCPVGFVCLGFGTHIMVLIFACMNSVISVFVFSNYYWTESALPLASACWSDPSFPSECALNWIHTWGPVVGKEDLNHKTFYLNIFIFISGRMTMKFLCVY